VGQLKYLEWLAIAMNLYIANEKFASMDFPMLSSFIFILLVIFMKACCSTMISCLHHQLHFDFFFFGICSRSGLEFGLSWQITLSLPEVIMMRKLPCMP
jgi:hypothetical protein